MNIRRKLASRLKILNLDSIPFCVSWIASKKNSFLNMLMPGRVKHRVTAKIFCQVHDDSDIVEDWIKWHAYLFGPANIYLIADRPSRQTRIILDKYSNLINILEAPLDSWPNDLGWGERKTENVNKAIQLYSGDSDFVIPIDIDEFVVFDGKVSKNKIHSELERLKKTSRNLFKFHAEYRASTFKSNHLRPVCEITDFTYYRRSYDSLKCFARTASFKRVGLGQHNIYSEDQSELAIISGLDLVHFEWRGKEHALNKVLQNANKMVVRSDGKMHMPRGGSQYHEGKHHYESGKFDLWLRSKMGSPTHVIVQLIDFLN